ncbi:hypothetical protein HYZ05_02380 [Candidatus Daviesbacteria bacterium]|nr:hypothetical protein [Candidatus Daviesbacteria bacterium]
MQASEDLLVPIQLGIIGYGFVGQAVANGFRETSFGKDTILWYDKYKDGNSLEDTVKSSEFIFVCLPTPMKQDETGIELSIFEEMIPQIAKYSDNTDKVVVIKSTVTPGTTVKFEKKFPKTHFCFNPEFLTEANFLDDFINAERTVIGANNDLILRRVAVIFKQRFPKTQIFLTDPTTAETVKYFANAFLSMKVTFANFFYDYCQQLGIKYEEVKKMAASDHRIGDYHLEITTNRGFGGKCFPKDLVAIMGEFKKLGVDNSLLETIWEYNKKIRKVHDWEEIPFAVGSKPKPKK